MTTVLFGRLYCGRVCAYGALTQLLDPIVPARFRYDVPLRIERHASKIKYGILAAVVIYFLATRDMSIYRYVEPFWMFTGHETMAMWIALGVLLVATVVVRNLYCRFLCPLGAALGLLSKLTIFGIKRWSECNTCKLCEKTCQWGAIEGPKIIMTECVRCDDCERLYMDQQKCPHWIILRGKVGSRQSARQPPVRSRQTVAILRDLTERKVCSTNPRCDENSALRGSARVSQRSAAWLRSLWTSAFGIEAQLAAKTLAQRSRGRGEAVSTRQLEPIKLDLTTIKHAVNVILVRSGP